MNFSSKMSLIIFSIFIVSMLTPLMQPVNAVDAQTNVTQVLQVDDPQVDDTKIVPLFKNLTVENTMTVQAGIPFYLQAELREYGNSEWWSLPGRWLNFRIDEDEKHWIILQESDITSIDPFTIHRAQIRVILNSPGEYTCFIAYSGSRKHCYKQFKIKAI